MPCTGPVQQEALAQTLRQRTASEYRKTRRGRSPCGHSARAREPRRPHKDKKSAGPARDADQTAPPDNAPRRGEARKGRSPCGTCPPHDAGRGPYAPQRRSARTRSHDLRKTRRGPQGLSPAGPSRRTRRMRIRKAPSASATPCPPAASRCSTLGEGGLNCRVRDGTG